MRSVECVDRFPHIPHSSFYLFKLDEYLLKPNYYCLVKLIWRSNTG